jgi:hypothetical protein
VAPSGSVPVRYEARRSGRARFIGLARLKTALLRGRLDGELAAGADPCSDAALARRATQLARPRYRRRLARSLERLVEDTDTDPRSYLSSAVPVPRKQVFEVRGTLLAIAGALRDVERVDVRGIALTLRLLTEPTSPLYTGAAAALQSRTHEALRRLLAGSHPWCDLPAAPPLPMERSHGHR